MSADYRGVFAALTTPFEEDEVSLDRVRENIDKYNQWDLAGYVVGGSTGEAIHLTDEECLSLIGAARKASAPGRKLIAGTARASARQTIVFTNRAADLGADAALIVLRDRLPSQPLRHAAATVRGIIATITGRGAE